MAQPAAKKRGPSITLDEPTPHNLQSIRLLNSTVLPVRYSKAFYDGLLKTPELTRLAYYNDLFVGAIAARYEKSETGTRIYIMTIGVLAPYRHLGIASKLLAHVERVAAEGTKHKVDEVTLHAWVANEDGIAFYKKHNYQTGAKLENYYKNIEPHDGVVLYKKVDAIVLPPVVQ